MFNEVLVRKYGTLIFVGIIIIGAFLRFYQLDDRSYTHIEFYIPGLDVPEYVWDPISRHTPAEVFSAPYKIRHPHLPGYDLIKLGWVKLFGTETYTIRASSAILGTLLIFLIFLYVRELAGPREALLAAALLALHGFQLEWSQFARQWMLLATLGVLSSLILWHLYKRWRPDLAFYYAVVCVIGLWVDSYFWPVMAAQMLWVYFQDADKERPCLIPHVQVVALVLATCALPYLIRFSRFESHVPSEMWARIVEMLQFAVIILPGSSIQPPDIVKIGIAILGTILIISGLMYVNKSEKNTDTVQSYTTEKSIIYILLAVTIVSPLISHLIFNNENVISHKKSFYFAAILPFFITAGWLFLRWRWKQFSYPGQLVMRVNILNRLSKDLPAVMMLVPFLLLVLINLRSSVLSSYALISLSPFFIAIISRGVFQQRRVFWLPVMIVILMICLYSIYQFKHIPDPRDYKEFATRLKPHMQKNDLLLIHNRWDNVAVVYYFPASSYESRPHIVMEPQNRTPKMLEGGRQFSRFWLVEFAHSEKQERIFLEKKKRLMPDNFREVKEIRGGKGIAVLYETDSPVMIAPDRRFYNKKQ